MRKTVTKDVLRNSLVTVFILNKWCRRSPRNLVPVGLQDKLS